MHIRSFGSQSLEGPPLVALHGFTFTGEQFAPLASRLGRPIHAPDLPGHGNSLDEPADFTAVVDAVVSHVAMFDHAPPLLGYSQGGRIALAAALRAPSKVSRLVLVSATAGIPDPDERSRRRVSDLALANRILDEGLDRFLADWTASGLTATTHLSPQDRTRDLDIRLQNTAAGLAAALTGYGQGTQPDLWGELPRLDVPTLVLAGHRDDKYESIARQVVELLPNGTLQVIADSGHNPLADQPMAVAAAVSGFLDGNR